MTPFTGQQSSAKKGPPFGRVPWNKGICVGDRIRKKKLFVEHSCRQCGKVFHAYPSEQRIYCSQSCRSKYVFAPERNPFSGKPLSDGHRANISAGHIGCQAKEKHPLWKGGRYKSLRDEDMASARYKQWRRAVLERDGFRCVQCGANKHLHADHIKPYVDYPFLRYDLRNGRTLCVNCHRKTPTWGVRARSKNV